jgi:hypothetical protein
VEEEEEVEFNFLMGGGALLSLLDVINRHIGSAKMPPTSRLLLLFAALLLLLVAGSTNRGGSSGVMLEEEASQAVFMLVYVPVLSKDDSSDADEGQLDSCFDEMECGEDVGVEYSESRRRGGVEGDDDDDDDRWELQSLL